MGQSRVSGHFITFEGGEGAGKSTQIKLLAKALRTLGYDVVETREPGGSPGAEQIRTLLVTGEVGRWSPMSEALLHYAARRNHVETTVMPALRAGQWVVSDRFADSTMAYQGYGHGMGRERIEQLHALALGPFKPDLTLILDLPVEAGLRRATAGHDGAEDRYERMDRAFHERHLPLTPGLAAALARLMQARRPDAERPWGNGFRLFGRFGGRNGRFLHQSRLKSRRI